MWGEERDEMGPPADQYYVTQVHNTAYKYYKQDVFERFLAPCFIELLMFYC